MTSSVFFDARFSATLRRGHWWNNEHHRARLFRREDRRESQRILPHGFVRRRARRPDETSIGDRHLVAVIFPRNQGDLVPVLAFCPWFRNRRCCSKTAKVHFVHPARNECPTSAWDIRRWDTRGTSVDRKTVLRASGDDSVLDRQGNQGPQNVRRSDG